MCGQPLGGRNPAMGGVAFRDQPARLADQAGAKSRQDPSDTTSTTPSLTLRAV
jgi:hypothetical protein